MIETAQAFGVDIGGSGIKAAPVDLTKGDFAEPRLKILTPEVSTPQAVAKIVKQQLDHFEVPESAPVGIAFPAPIKPGQKLDFMANLDQSWIGVDVTEVFSEACGRPVVVVNDADAAGSAEINFGVGRGRRDGVLMMLTVGTGIGVSMFSNRTLVPNLELGHLRMRDKALKKYIAAEKICSDAARKSHDLSWQQWAGRFNKYLQYVHSLCWPDLIVIGGGVASKSDKFLKYIKADCDIAIARLENRAGIIGAAYEASKNI